MGKFHLLTCLIFFLNFEFAYSQVDEISHLYASGIELFNKKKYNDAEKEFEKCLRFHEIDSTKLHAQVLTYLADCRFIKEDYLNAIDMYSEAIGILENILDVNNTNDMTILCYIVRQCTITLIQLANYYAKSLDIDSSINYMELALEGVDRLEAMDYNINSILDVKYYIDMYIKCLNIKIQNYIAKENYTKAIYYEKRLVNIWNKWKVKDLEYANILKNIASHYSKLGKFSDAILYSEQRIVIIKKKDAEYAEALFTISSYYYHIGDYSKAKKLGEQALNIYKNSSKKDDLFYAIMLHDMASRNYAMGFYSDGILLDELAIKIYEAISCKHTIYYALLLNDLASSHAYLGNHAQAIKYEEEAIKIFNQLSERQQNSNKSVYIPSYNSKCLGKTHDNLCKKYTDKASLEYSFFLATRALYLSQLGNHLAAISVCEQVCKIRRGLLGKEHKEYAKSLSNLTEEYANSLSNLAIEYYFVGNYTEAIKLSTLALEIRSQKSNKIMYARSLNNLAVYQLASGNDSDVRKNCEKALEVIDSIQEKYSFNEYPATLNTLASYHLKKGNYSHATKLAKQSLDILYKTESKESDHYIDGIGTLTDCLFITRNSNSLSHYSFLINNILGDKISKTFRELTSTERERFWNKYKDWYTTKLNKYTYFYPTDTLCMSAYNGALVSKGILLNSEIEMRKLIHESGDTIADYLYNEIRINNMMLQRLYEKPVAERLLNTDSLENIVKKLEKQLIKRSKIFGDYTKNLRIDWKDVMDKLGEKDIAIEFCSFPQSEDSTMYMALVLSKGMDCPKMIPLFEEKQIKKQKDKYSNHETARLVWEPLKEHLNKSRNVYFGPTGELYNIAIENIPHWNDDCLMSEKWNLFRLSSTRELAVIKDNSAIKKASVYGGISYNTETNVLINDTVEYGKQRRDFVGMYELADSINIRGGVNYLPSTKTEAEQVNKELKQKHIASSLRMGTLATEGSFKDLSGKRMNLLHIATHGFYWTKTKAKLMNKLSFLLHSNNPPRYIEDKAMNRSGLLFAGANNVLSGKKLPEGVNDGILTASEIAHLDLRGLDLVVLSACQTGLGEITGDGVFGLQRGFKKAGANSILMTLWEVADKATSLFMTEFYKAFMSGMSKQEAVTAAQKYVRDYESISEDNTITHPYQDPKFWAGFILLDAIH